MAKIVYATEYRINKKGAECFRTRDRNEAMSKLSELNAKRPGIYTLQRRTCRYNTMIWELETDYLGRPAWSPWN